MLAETNRDCISVDELCETEDFKKIDEVIAKHCDCEGIIIDEIIKESSWREGYASFDGHVDHQSVMSIHDFLDEYDCTLEEYIFDSGIELIIDNDNH